MRRHLNSMKEILLNFTWVDWDLNQRPTVNWSPPNTFVISFISGHKSEWIAQNVALSSINQYLSCAILLLISILYRYSVNLLDSSHVCTSFTVQTSIICCNRQVSSTVKLTNDQILNSAHFIHQTWLQGLIPQITLCSSLKKFHFKRFVFHKDYNMFIYSWRTWWICGR